MICTDRIHNQMVEYLENEEMLCGTLLVRRAGEIVYQSKWGHTDIERKRPVEFDSIFRIMSMTKPIIAVGLLMLMERDLLSIDDPLKKYIPAFGNMRVAKNTKYALGPGFAFKLEDIPRLAAEFKLDAVETEALERDITLKDVLSHSSGLGQGLISLFLGQMVHNMNATLEEQMEEIAQTILDFQPGTDTGYSPSIGFNVLGRVIEVVSGMSLEEFCTKEIFQPLGMKDTCFNLQPSQRERLVALCRREGNKLLDITAEHEATKDNFKARKGYVSGSGGLYSTLNDYEHFVRMLYDRGAYNGKQFLRPETVELMHTEAPEKHMESLPGQVWGLGVRIRQEPEKGGNFTTAETYGWSGAYGTHFFISPKDDLECVFMTNRTDLMGSESYISLKVEELVFGEFAR